MSFPSDLEIARSVTPRRIADVAARRHGRSASNSLALLALADGVIE